MIYSQFSGFRLTVLLFILLYPLLTWGQPSGLSGDDPVLTDDTNFQLTAPDTKLGVPDDFVIWFGTNEDYGLQYDATNTRWEFITTDSDGIGTNADLIRVEDASALVEIIDSLKVGTLNGMIKGTSGTLSAVNGGANQVTFWSDSDTIGADSNLTWDGSTLTVTGNLTTTGTTTLNTGLTGILEATAGVLSTIGSLTDDRLARISGSGTTLVNSIVSESGQVLTLNGGASTLQTASGDLTLESGDSNDVLLNPSGGNVGIGTTSPQELVHIYSTGTAIKPHLLVVNNFGTGANGNIAGIGFEAGENTSSHGPKGSLGYIRTGSFGRGDFVILQDSAADSGSAVIGDEVMRITNSGNVGIGTTSPGAKLDVNGDIKINGNWLLQSETEDTVDRLTLKAAGSNDAAELFLHPTGSATTSRITISDDPSTANYEGLAFETTATESTIESIKAGTGTAQPIKIKMDGTDVVTVQQDNDVVFENGSVGIGTASPLAKLQLGDGGSDDRNLLLLRGDAPRAYWGTDVGNTNWKISAQDAVSDTLEISYGGTDTDPTNNTYTQALVIKNTGNVGINTTSPNEKLEVNGNLRLSNETPSRLAKFDSNTNIVSSTITVAEIESFSTQASRSLRNGLRFDGTAGSYVDFGDDADFTMHDSDLTIIVVAQAEDTGAAQSLVSKDDNSNREFGFRINGDSLSAILFDSGGGTNYTEHTGGTLSDNTPFSGAFTWDGTTGSLYVNGQAVTTTPTDTGSGFSTFSDTAEELLLAEKGDGNELLTGRLHQALVFNVALSAAEVEQIYDSGIPHNYKWGSQTAQTSGTLEVGQSYRINTYVSADDFTNVGASSNATGEEFVATGTTPTTWTNGSSLVPIGVVVAPDFDQGVGFQLEDISSNDHHGIFGASSGITWVRPEDHGKVVKVDAATANGTLLGSGFTLPANAVINNVLVRETAGTTLSDFYISTVSGSSSDAITVSQDISASSADSLQIIDTVSGGSGIEELFFNASDWGSGGTVTISMFYNVYE